MKIVLLEDILTLGRKGDVKEVSRGYARNFLLPKGLAKIATNDMIKSMELKKQAKLKQEELELEKIKALSESIEGKKITIKVKTGEKNQLFESISPAMILTAAKKLRLKPDNAEIVLDEHIKKTGEYPVVVNLGHNIKAKILIEVVGESKETKAKTTKKAK